MATTTANKMSTLISKGKLPAFQVTQLIHQQYIKDLNCEGIAGLSETDLQKLINNLDVRDWNNVKHWVHDGIDLLYAFAMNIKSDAALAAANLHMVNTFLIKMIHVDQSNKLHLDPNNWEGIHSSMGAFIHRVLWYHAALLVVNTYIKAEWSSIASMGMQSMMSAIGLINETLDGSDLEPFVVEHLQPSEEVIESWRHEVKVVLIRDFLLGVVEGEVVG